MIRLIKLLSETIAGAKITLQGPPNITLQKATDKGKHNQILVTNDNTKKTYRYNLIWSGLTGQDPIAFTNIERSDEGGLIIHRVTGWNKKEKKAETEAQEIKYADVKKATYVLGNGDDWSKSVLTGTILFKKV